MIPYGRNAFECRDLSIRVHTVFSGLLLRLTVEIIKEATRLLGICIAGLKRSLRAYSIRKLSLIQIEWIFISNDE